MRTLFLIAALFLIESPFAQAQEAETKIVGQNQMARVLQEVRLIEEESLPVDSSLQARKRSMSDLSGAGAGAASLKEDGGPQDNGLKLYRFTLAPGEKMTSQITSDGADWVTQRFGDLSGPNFTASSASKGQINRINRLNRQQRATKINFTNLENRPFPLLLVVYGQVGHPYKIHISRDSSR